MSNLIESMINENVQFSKGKELKKSDKKVVKENRKKVKEGIESNTREFMNYHENPHQYNISLDMFNAIYEILDKYGDEDDVEILFRRASEEDQQKILSLLRHQSLKRSFKFDESKKRVNEATDENGYEVPLYTKYFNYKGDKYDVSLWEDDGEYTIDIGEWESGPYTEELLKADFIMSGQHPGWSTDSVAEGKEMVNQWIDWYNEWSSKYEESLKSRNIKKIESKSHRRVTEAADDNHEVYIIVENGRVQDVFSTTARLNVSVLDFDTTDPDEKEEINQQYEEINQRVAGGELKYVW